MDLTLITLFIIIGALFAFPAYLPPLRKRARASSIFRDGLILILSLTTFIVFHLTVTWIGVGIGIFYGSCDMVRAFDTLCYPVDSEDNYSRELWLRAITPPPLLPDDYCFSNNPALCETVNTVSTHYRPTLWQYVSRLRTYLIPAFACGFVVYLITGSWRNTRKKKKRQIETLPNDNR